MSSVAIIQLTDRHTEVVGGMITLFGKLFKYIDIYYKSYDSNFCNYYKDVLKSPNYTIRLHKNPKKIGKHDLYVFMTGLEYVDFEEDILNLNIPPERTLLLSHHLDEYKEDLKYLKDIAGVFAISPVYKKYKKVPYFFTYSNIVNKVEKKSGEKINLFLSGFTNPDNKDLDGLMRLMDYLYEEGIDTFKFHVVNYYPIEELEKYRKICKVYVDMKARPMMKLLEKSDYVMTLTRKNSSYHNKQLTGIIPLAISMGVPLIIDKDLSKIYGMTSRNAIVYPFKGVNTIKKTVLSLVNVSPAKYHSIQRGVLSYRKKMITQSQKKMKMYIKDIF